MHFSEEEVAHWLLPRAGVVHSYVVQVRAAAAAACAHATCAHAAAQRHARHAAIVPRSTRTLEQ